MAGHKWEPAPTKIFVPVCLWCGVPKTHPFAGETCDSPEAHGYDEGRAEILALLAKLPRFNCDCLNYDPADPKMRPADGDHTVYCERAVVLAEDLERLAHPSATRPEET